ncbi:glycosyltransferase family 1 protein [Anaerolineales bacterium HSG24]|nr:glycosyltransferase family 1 protein [Anaerolineales bacterium HSG24]
MTTIGIDYTSALHQSAGIGRYTSELVSSLINIDLGKEYYNYRLFSADLHNALHSNPIFASNKQLSNHNQFLLRGTRLSRRWLERLWYRLRLPLYVELWTGRLDLFHAPDFVLPPVLPKTRTIVTIHDLSYVRLPDITMPGMSNYLNKWVPYSVKTADHVIAVSEATRQDLIELYQTPSEKITIIYHGVTPEFRPMEDESSHDIVCETYNINDKPFILSVGTIQPRKNYQRLIQSFAQTLSRLPEPLSDQLILVIGGGKGWQYETIYNEVTRLGLENRVRFIGFVADEDLPALYNAATIFAYPALYEGFGLPALEAMACGTPVLVANTSALPEVVGQAGRLVDPYNVPALAQSMVELLTDEAQRQQLRQAGLHQAAKFSWAEMATNLIALYGRVLD